MSGLELRDAMWRVEVRHCPGCETIADNNEDLPPGDSVVLVANFDDEDLGDVDGLD